MVRQALTGFTAHLNTTAKRLANQIVRDMGAQAAATLIPFGGEKRME